MPDLGDCKNIRLDTCHEGYDGNICELPRPRPISWILVVPVCEIDDLYNINNRHNNPTSLLLPFSNDHLQCRTAVQCARELHLPYRQTLEQKYASCLFLTDSKVRFGQELVMTNKIWKCQDLSACKLALVAMHQDKIMRQIGHRGTPRTRHMTNQTWGLGKIHRSLLLLLA